MLKISKNQNKNPGKDLYPKRQLTIKFTRQRQRIGISSEPDSLTYSFCVTFV